LPESAASLELLAEHAVAGDARAESELFTRLGVSLRQVAKRRVPEDDLEDLVQEALTIAHGKYRDRHAPTGLLPWSFAVLRNVIGNYYQARRRREGHEEFRDEIHAAAVTPEPGSLEQRELQGLLVRAIHRLGLDHPRCESIFRSILDALAEGGSSREISAQVWDSVRGEEPGLTRGAFYVVLHRCRGRLRELLS